MKKPELIIAIGKEKKNQCPHCGSDMQHKMESEEPEMEDEDEPEYGKDDFLEEAILDLARKIQERK